MPYKKRVFLDFYIDNKTLAMFTKYVHKQKIIKIKLKIKGSPYNKRVCFYCMVQLALGHFYNVAKFFKVPIQVPLC